MRGALRIGRVREHAWAWFVVVGIAMTAGYFALGPRDQDFAYQVPEMVAVAVIVAGIRLHRPADPMPWLMLALGLLLTTIGDWAFLILDRVFEIEPFPSVADAFYLGGMVLVALGILRLVRGRIPCGDRASLLDALIVAVGVALLSWVFLMAPVVADPGQSFGEIAVALAYPALDILLLGVLVRLVLAPGTQVPAVRLVILALVAYLLADFPYAVMALDDTYTVGNLVDAGWLLGAVLWGAAALHPSMAAMGEPVWPGEVRFSKWRLVLLAGASLMAPAVLLVQWLAGKPLDVPVVAAGSVVLFLLVIARLAGVVADLRATLDQRHVLERELERRALHDPLTGLANRVLFRDRLEHALSRRTGGVAVMFCDLDDFKTVNDAQGHAAGDGLLRSVAETLRTCLRPEDTVARLGGDEFAILLTDGPDRYQAGLVAGRLLDALRQPIAVADTWRAVGASIGIALASSAPDDPARQAAGGSVTRMAEALMRDADIAMYVAKGEGKGTFTVFEPAEHAAVVRGLELRTDLDRGIREQQFELHYQPIIDLETGAVAGVEALARWRHPTRGLLGADDFIPLAETTGAIVPLGQWILRTACAEAARWQPDARPGRPGRSAKSGKTVAAGGHIGPFVSVNLSAMQFVEPGVVELVRTALADSGLAAHRLVLELTETARLDHRTASANLGALRSMGVRLAIDDFGTGYAGLSRLARSHFDMLKIDQAFVATIGTDARAESFFGGIMDLARRLEMQAVAEGIVDGVQLARLRENGCPLGQGYHFSHPMPPAELRVFLRDSEPASAPARRRARRTVPAWPSS